jgi:hypothetical protein
MKQLLLEGSRNLGIGYQLPSGFGELACFQKRAQQRSEGTGRRHYYPGPRWRSDGLPGQGFAACGQLLWRQGNETPVPFSNCPLMRPLAEAMENHVTRVQAKPAIYQAR